MIKYNEIVLEKLRFGIRKLVTDELLGSIDQVELLSYADHFTKDMVYELRAMLVGERLKEIEVKYPSDWWEAVKERFAPSWFNAKYPVRYEKERLTAKAVYPLISLPEKRYFVHLQKDGGWL